MDTVGCGDSFVAAIAYGYIHNLPLVHTLTIANAVGAATATGCGAGRNVANLQKVRTLIKESNLNEDDKFWNKLLEESSNKEDITFLSKTTVNGFKNGSFNHVNVQKVVSEVLHKLETSLTDGILSSWRNFSIIYFFAIIDLCTFNYLEQEMRMLEIAILYGYDVFFTVSSEINVLLVFGVTIFWLSVSTYEVWLGLQKHLGYLTRIINIIKFAKKLPI